MICPSIHEVMLVAMGPLTGTEQDEVMVPMAARTHSVEGRYADR